MIYVVDNFYSDQEYDCVRKELDFYSSLPEDLKDRAENTDVARTGDGHALGQSFRVYVNNIFTREGSKYSHTNNLAMKIRNFHTENIEENLPNGRQFKDMDTQYNMISYYGPNDYYDSHYDKFQFTALIWVFKEPKKFTGGDLFFEEINRTVEVTNNRMCIFPSYLLHKVNKINMSEDDFRNGYGRYTITHFFTHNGG